MDGQTVLARLKERLVGPTPPTHLPVVKGTPRREGGGIERFSFAVRALDDRRDHSYRQETYPRDRYAYDRQETLRAALEAWRVNPLARRIVELTTQYVLGSGLALEADHPATHAFLQVWWHHPLNRMDTRAIEWCDELSRSGELFVVLSTDATGMSYVRAIPAVDIQEIEAAENDAEQEVRAWENPPGTGLLEGRSWLVYNPAEDGPREDGSFEPVILHYAINRPVGARRGESDLAPLLRWLSRYAAWLEDRARLNRYRNTFLFWVKARFTSGEERLRRQAELNASPPNPGSILVTDESEEWSVLGPNLASFEAAADGLALKKMVSAGSGAPLHFLAEPESSTRTTAESAGDPTYRRYQQRQQYFAWLVKDLAQAAARRRSLVDRQVRAEATIEVHAPDISPRDNAALATAAASVIEAFGGLHDRGLIDGAELLRLAYRFAGEVVPTGNGRRDGSA